MGNPYCSTDSKECTGAFFPLTIDPDKILTRHDGLVRSAVWNSDETRILTALSDNIARVWAAIIPVAGYISHTRSRELTSLLLFAAKEQGYENDLNHIIDRHVAGFFLKPMERSTLFVCSSTIAKLYPDHLKPYFFYFHVGDEISRVEVPAWVAKDERLVQLVCGIVLDQVGKGYGYPICLAEAHEQAVVKGADRDFFYHLIHKIGLEEHKRLLISPKNLKKRRMGI